MKNPLHFVGIRQSAPTVKKKKKKIVSRADILDKSILDQIKCTSELRVKIRGIGSGFSVPEARKKCKEDCQEQVDYFKRTRCPQLCGFRALQALQIQVCSLCVPNANKLINLCRSLISRGVRQCTRGCDTADFSWDGPKVYLTSITKEIIRKFPSKVN